MIFRRTQLQKGTIVRIKPEELLFNPNKKSLMVYTGEGFCEVLGSPLVAFLDFNEYGLAPGLYSDIYHVNLKVMGNGQIIHTFPLSEIQMVDGEEYKHIDLDWFNIDYIRGAYESQYAKPLPEQVRFYENDSVVLAKTIVTKVKRVTVFDNGRITYSLNGLERSIARNEIELMEPGDMRLALEEPSKLIFKDKLRECQFWSKPSFSYPVERESWVVEKPRLRETMRRLNSDSDRDCFAGFKQNGFNFQCQIRKMHPRFAHFEGRAVEASVTSSLI